MKIDGLIKKISQGDKGALTALYNETKRQVYAYALSILKNRACAEDIMADAFVTVFKNAHQYRGGSGKAWIISITRNLCFNHIKKRQREVSVDYSENESLYGEYSIEEDFAEHTELKAALSTLDQTEREIVLMFNSGFRHREIAEVLNLPLGTVTWKYKQSLLKLKQIMSGGVK